MTLGVGHIKRRVGRIVQKLAQKPIYLTRDDKQALPGAFVIAPFRSGTTLVRLILDSHPDIAAPPETFMFSHILAPLRDERMTRAMWNLGYHRDAMALALGDCARGFLEGYALSKGKRFWIEKTPAYVDLLPELREAMPDARYIMLYRHPYDIVRSMNERNMVATQPEIACHRAHHPSDLATYCAFVADQHGKMRAFQEAHPDRCVELRYERLVAAPKDEIGALCGFLGLPYADAMLDFQNAPHDTGFGDEKIHRTAGIEARPAAGARTFGKGSEARTYLAATIRELGYEL